MDAAGARALRERIEAHEAKLAGVLAAARRPRPTAVEAADRANAASEAASSGDSESPDAER